MKAAVLREFGKPLVIEDIEAPVPTANEVLIRMHACGIDGTDLKLLDGFGYHPELPFIMGHEPAGVIEQIGDAVTNINIGDRVVTHNFFMCGTCELCRNNRGQLCPNMTRVLGVKDAPGGYAEYMKIPATQAVQLPGNISFKDAATLSDAGITAFHAVDRARIAAGEIVLVIGVGGVGSYAVQFAKLRGARVIAAETTAAKCAHALTLGVDEVVNSTDSKVTEQCRELTGGRGVDCVIDIVGQESTIAAGVDSLFNGGRIVIVGYTTDSYPLNGKQLAQNELEIIGTRCGRKQDLTAAAALLSDGKVKSIVTDSAPLENVNEALARLRAGEVLGRCVLEIA